MSILENWTKRFMGLTLYGEVAEDPTGRFVIGSIFCSSIIDRIDADAMLIHTDSGSTYELEGPHGRQFDAWLDEVKLLRNGYYLAEIVAQRRISL